VLTSYAGYFFYLTDDKISLTIASKSDMFYQKAGFKINALGNKREIKNPDKVEKVR